MSRKVQQCVLWVPLLTIALFGAANDDPESLAEEVREELASLPYYGVFDFLTFRLQRGHVTLMGQVSRPTLKDAAETVVEDVEGVTSVSNKIEILPASPDDDTIRQAVYQAIYSQPGLQRYALGAVPSIHIIVKNGHVALRGVVTTEVDKNIAGAQAKTVSGVFSVENHLLVTPS